MGLAVNRVFHRLKPSAAAAGIALATEKKATPDRATPPQAGGKPRRRRFTVPAMLGWGMLERQLQGDFRSGRLAPLRLDVPRRLVEVHLLIDLADPVQRNEVMLAVRRIMLGKLDLVL